MKRFSWYHCFYLILIANIGCKVTSAEESSNVDNESQPLSQYVSENGGLLMNSSKEPNGKYKVQVKYDSTSTKNIENNNSTQYFICSFIIAPFGRSWEIIGGTKKCELISEGGESSKLNSNEEVETTTWKTKVFGLVHEIQMNDGTATSGEQFVAVRKEPGYVWCADCPTDINLQAEGVPELASQALQHLNRHHPAVTHSLTTRGVIQVQRQAQIVNGVRYTVILEVQSLPRSSENCNENCEPPVPEVKVCQVTFLEKPWVTLPNGNKFRAVLYNNCTEEYSFGDNGEALNGNVDVNDDKIGDTNVKKVESYNVNAAPVQDKLTPERIKDIEEQIITESTVEDKKELEIVTEKAIVENNNQDVQHSVQEVVTQPKSNDEERKIEPILPNASESNIQEIVANNNNNEVFSPVNEQTVESESNSIEKTLSQDQKKALEMFLSVYGFDPMPFDQQTQVDNNMFEQQSQVVPGYPTNTQPILVNRKKRDVYNSDEENKLVQELANFAVQTVDMFDDDDLKRVILKIISYRKVIKTKSASSYLIKAKVGFSSCEESSEASNCASTLLYNNIKICDMQVDIKPNGEKNVAKSQCHKQMHKRSLNIDLPNPESNPKFIKMVQQAMRKYEEDLCSPNFYDILEIYMAKKRAIGDEVMWRAGVTIQEVPCCIKNNCNEIKKSLHNVCAITAYENQTESFRIHSVECVEVSLPSYTRVDFKYMPSIVSVALDNIDNDNESENNSINLPVDHPDILDITAKSLRQYEMDKCSAHKHKLVKILKSSLESNKEDKVIKIEFTIKKADACNKADIDTDTKCDTLNNKCHLMLCLANFSVTDNTIQVNCHFVQKKIKHNEKQTLNDYHSWQTIPVDDPNIIFLTHKSLQQFDEDTRVRHEIKNIESAKSDGENTKLLYFVNECSKDNMEQCDNSTVYECNTYITQHSDFYGSIIIKNFCLDVEKKKNLQNNNEIKEKFESFTKKYEKEYELSMEYDYRLQVFADNLIKIDQFNSYEKGTATYGITKFTDLPYYEFRKMYTGLLNSGRGDENSIGLSQADIPTFEDLPTEFDWRTKGVVTDVKDQGQCGSCWAFSVTGNVEGLWKIKTDKLLSLSEQELVDCDRMDEGCNGGTTDNAYLTIEKLGGLELEQDYPYNAEQAACHFNKTIAKVPITGAVNISKDEVEMQKWLYANGPMSISINANAMQFYYGGVSHPFKFLCSSDNLDHGVLIVGWGVHRYPLFNRVMPYWIVKNSWGPMWGEQGYYRVYRGDGTCGLNQYVTSAVL